jgi:ATP-dependent DNA helicase RecG
MVNYGDMDISIIDEKPKGRVEIETKIITPNKIPDLLKSLSEKMQNNEQVFWVCPLIEESEKIDLANATARFEDLNNNFPEKTGMIHGKMKAHERDDILTRFANGELKLLISTTVIEVGIDIPNATVMVIENAERFGLAQLHQLRGRVGRGEKKSYCILLTKNYLSPDSFNRLNVLKNSNDGFYISEQDLKIRGTGDLLGIKQSGLPTFKFVNIEEHQTIIEEAQEYAKNIILNDPNLEQETTKNLKILLQIFETHTSEKLVA